MCHTATELPDLDTETLGNTQPHQWLLLLFPDRKWSPPPPLGSRCRASAVKLTVLEVGGADGLLRETISWMASRSLSRCSGLLIPVSLWISVSDSADMMAPLFTLARRHGPGR